MIENAAGDFPQMMSLAGYTSTTGQGVSDWSQGVGAYYADVLDEPEPLQVKSRRRIQNPSLSQNAYQFQKQIEAIKKQLPMDKETSNRRIVQIFIADPDQNVPLANALLYKTDPFFTDLTDQELYFEAGIPEKLKVHNEKRVKWVDKEATKKSGKDIFLEPIKVRDLRMVVVQIAAF